MVAYLANTSAFFLAQSAEILLRSFGVRYLHRGSWQSRQQLIDHLYASTPENNRLWAQPINWSWTRRDLHNWATKKSAGLFRVTIIELQIFA